jgi:hypothetical protein
MDMDRKGRGTLGHWDMIYRGGGNYIQFKQPISSPAAFIHKRRPTNWAKDAGAKGKENDTC